MRATVALDAARAWRALIELRPDRSAHRRLTYIQMACLAAAAGALAWAVWRAPGDVWHVSHALAFAAFAAAIAVRFAAAASAYRLPISQTVSEDAPVYTIICPLRGEAEVARDLVVALDQIAYPRERLQIILALEADDDATRTAVEALGLQAPYEIVLAPLEGPRTKPKALNVALAHARGEFCTIYDAEDRPHPHQLTTAAAAFRAGGVRLACVQAPLLADNPHASWISAQFAAEYAIQFLTMLPLFSRLGLPLPLGGTSNHFRVDVLREIGGWDSYNVTEDADLGYRLARQGWRAQVIGAPTYEEAPVTLSAWQKQRTRWIKGHLQTWFVLMRNPLRTARELGILGFLSMQLVLAGGVLAALVHLPLAALMLTSAFTIIELAAADFMLALIGYAVAIYGGAVGANLAGSPRVALAALTMPLYWPLLFAPAVGAIVGFVFRPFYWAKTAHGVSVRPDLPSAAARRPSLSPTPRQRRAASARAAQAAQPRAAARNRG